MQSVLLVVDLHCTFPLPFHQRILFGTQSHFRKCPTSKEPPQLTAIIHRSSRVIIRSYIKDNFEYDIDKPNIQGLSYGLWKFRSEQLRKHKERSIWRYLTFKMFKILRIFHFYYRKFFWKIYFFVSPVSLVRLENL